MKKILLATMALSTFSTSGAMNWEEASSASSIKSGASSVSTRSFPNPAPTYGSTSTFSTVSASSTSSIKSGASGVSTRNFPNPAPIYGSTSTFSTVSASNVPSGTESTKSFYAAGMNSETGSYSPRASTSTSTGGSVIIKEIESIKETARQLLTRQENFLIMREQDAKAAAIQMANIMRAQQKRHEEEIERLRKEKLAEIERLEKERLAEIEKRIAAEKKEALHRQVMAVCLRHGLNQTNIIRRCSMKGIEKKSGIERYNAVSAIYDKTLSPFEKLFDDKNNLRSLGDFLYKNKGGKEYACFPSLAFESLIREVNGFLRTQ